MIKAVYMIFCDNYTIDEITKKISCMGFVEEIVSSVFPMKMGVSIIFGLTGIKEDKPEKVKLQIKKGQKNIGEAESNINSAGKNKITDVIGDFKNYLINEAGTYTFLLLDSTGSEIVKRSINFVQKSIEEQGGESSAANN